MFEKVLSKEALEAVDDIAPLVYNFYLGGGTALALQLGHRKSADLDFFSRKPFDSSILLERISPESVGSVREGTMHCEKKGAKLSFLIYIEPLIYPAAKWRDIKIADWRDIAAEKFKAVSQRGARRDFYDLYAVLMMKSTIEEACALFKNRFTGSGINNYHTLKSLVFFDDAEDEPQPAMLVSGKEWEWVSVKAFFEKNIKEFEKRLIL